MHSAQAEILANTCLTGTANRDPRTDRHRAGAGRRRAGRDGRPGAAEHHRHALATGLGTAARRPARSADRRGLPGRRGRARAGRLVERIAIARSQPNVIAREALQGRPDTATTRRQGDAGGRRGRRCRPRRVQALHTKASAAARIDPGDGRRLEPSDAVAQIGEALGVAGRRPGRELAPLPGQRRRRAVVHRDGAVQSQIRLSGQAIPRTNQRYPALQLANLVYGGFFCRAWWRTSARTRATPTARGRPRSSRPRRHAAVDTHRPRRPRRR